MLYTFVSIFCDSFKFLKQLVTGTVFIYLFAQLLCIMSKYFNFCQQCPIINNSYFILLTVRNNGSIFTFLTSQPFLSLASTIVWENICWCQQNLGWYNFSVSYVPQTQSKHRLQGMLVVLIVQNKEASGVYTAS